MKNSIPEHKLINRCIKGDKRAEYELFCHYAKPMVNVALRITGNSFDAEDVVQDAFIKAFKKLKRFNGDASFGSWLKRIVVNEALMLLRKQKMVFEELIEGTIHENSALNLEPSLKMETLLQCIYALPDGARIVFCLKAIENYKLVEVAEMLGISNSNAKVQYHRARQLLKCKLKDKVYAE